MPWQSNATQSLEKAISFDESDLAANRDGRLSAAQRTMLAERDAEFRSSEQANRRMWQLLCPTLLVVTLMELFGVGPSRGCAASGPDNRSLGSVVAWLPGVLGLIYSMYRVFGRQTPLPSHDLRSIEGELLFDEPDEGYASFQIEGLDFIHLSDEVAAAFSHGARYRVYYTHVSRTGALLTRKSARSILSAEPAPDQLSPAEAPARSSD